MFSFGISEDALLTVTVQQRAHNSVPLTKHTHIDSISTNMKFSSVSFLAAVFSSPPSTPLFGGSSSVMVRILCSVCDDTAKMTWRRRDDKGDE
jgi:hypothetical protein